MATGGVAAVVAWVSLNKVGQTALLKKVDDTFSVLHTHGVAGLTGGLCVGLFANPAMTVYYAKDKKGVPTADGGVSVGGVFYTHDFKQLWIQFLAALAIIAWNIVATFIVPLRASDGDIEGGDLAIHGIDPMPVYLTPKTNGTPTQPSAPVG